MAGRRGALVGSGKEAEVFEYGDSVLKLYRRPEGKGSAFREAGLLAAVERFGLPTPAVERVGRFGDRWGLVMSRAAGTPLAGQLAAGTLAPSAVIAEMVALQAAIHASAAPGLPSLKARLRSNIGRAPGLADERRRQLLAGLESLPDGDRLCHGDFHPWNIIGQPGTTTVVDWLDAGAGPPAADACRSYLLMLPSAPALAAAYLDAYTEAAGLTRDAILAWLPCVAAARLAEGVPDETEALIAMANGEVGS
jgi:aminoglycoside phosphotransferase (APT) family kinase protein